VCKGRIPKPTESLQLGQYIASPSKFLLVGLLNTILVPSIVVRMARCKNPSSIITMFFLHTVVYSCSIWFQSVEGFVRHQDVGCVNTNPKRFHRPLLASNSALDDPLADETAIQWELFNRHHARGSWKGIWSTYDYIGDVIDETVASVDLNPTDTGNTVEHSHTIVVGAKRSDCKTCFDSMEQKTLPVATYTPDNILQRRRMAGVSMVIGPTLVRAGSMATELILSHGDGRIRVTFYHAPVWERGVEPGSCPPQGLKLFRTMLSREALRPTAPTADIEATDPPTEGNPIFYRPVPPFNWHKKWSGTSWTWGPQTGNRGWRVDELDETDSWHGITPVDCWNLRLGGVHLQAPRVITDATVGICRLAWLPDDETLLRVEAGISALQPMLVDDDTMVGFAPPSLTSLRCDMLQKVGELDDVPIPSREWGEVEGNVASVRNEADDELRGKERGLLEDTVSTERTNPREGGRADSSKHTLRDSLSL
jgi:hypothetical protein